MVEPNRMMARTETVEPKCAKSKIDRPEPMITLFQMLKVDPNRAKARTLSELPSVQQS
jgi:hypothetical protein